MQLLSVHVLPKMIPLIRAFFVLYTKNICLVTPKCRNEAREYFLADVEAIVDTAAVIPDIGCPNKNAYFLLQQRSNWAKMFDSWLELPHEAIDLYQLEDFFSSDEEEDTSDGE